MGRPTRKKGPGAAVHIWQRGNHQESVFLSPADNRRFVGMLERSAQRFQMRILAYCLMRNHYHVVAAGERLDSVEKAIGQANHDYSLYLHGRREQKGQLWEGRYGSVILDELHFWTAFRYVELNPVDAGIVTEAGDWPWSSARAHLGLEPARFLDMTRWGERYRPETWQKALGFSVYESSLRERLEEAVHSGRGIKDEEFHRMRLKALAAGKPTCGKVVPGTTFPQVRGGGRCCCAPGNAGTAR